MIDEFQDISTPRAKMIQALQSANADTKLFAVGDDFQSIYRFAGSDITLMTNFTEHFGRSWEGKLQTTYRSNDTIAKAAADFVKKNPSQINKKVASTRKGIPYSVRAVPYRYEYSPNTPLKKTVDTILDRLNVFAQNKEQDWKSATQEKLTVLILFRYWSVNPFQSSKPNYSHIQVITKSLHQSKGLESDYVLLLDVNDSKYGIPSKIEDDELLRLVTPLPEDYPFSEERRLFYVGLTRAIRGVFLIYDEAHPSLFITEIEKIIPNDLRYESPSGQRLKKCPRCRIGFIKKKQSRYKRAFESCNKYPKCSYSI
jgi:DNA helicase-4